MIPFQYAWLVWSAAFLMPWLGLYLAFPRHRRVMIRASLVAIPFGHAEPLSVPEYRNPPSLYHLARRSGFDVESLIFCFGIGVGAVLVDVLTAWRPRPMYWAGVYGHCRCRSPVRVGTSTQPEAAS